MASTVSARRAIVDEEKSVSVALPAAAANVNTASIDLGEHQDMIENAEIEIAIDLTTALVDTKDIDVKIQDSANDASFADVAVYTDPLLKVTSAGGGNPETKAHFRVHRALRRYIRINIAVESGGGTVTGEYGHLRLVF